MKYIDPDGRDIKIWYQENGKHKSFSFNGSNSINAPNNAYVQDAISSYNHNVENGGGDRMREAAIGSNTIELTYSDDNYGGNGTNRNAVFWNNEAGLLTEAGDIISPATMLEHEMDHALKKIEIGASEFNKSLRNDGTSYRNSEEKRVIRGSELKTV